MIDTLKKIGAMAPQSRSEMGKLQQRLVTAGYRSHEAVTVFFGIRLGCALAGLRAAGDADRRASRTWRWRWSAARSAICCRAWRSDAWPRSRQHRIRLGLPDALDLLVVSVEAGLGLDQAIQRVGDELDFAHPGPVRGAAADQPRAARRQGRASTRCATSPSAPASTTSSSLVAMLVQTDKFGTSVAQSLRVHSDTVRTKRRQRAEEAAAKTGVKMVFPLVFCIFPAIWVVTIGPAVIKFIQVIVPMAHQ